jgi:hypothetical protein
MTFSVRKGVLLAAGAVAAVVVMVKASDASDHIDGLKTTVDNAADVTDVFAFTSPNDANKLVLIMNVHTLANSRSRFSDAVDYRFRIRPIADAQTMTPSSDASKERSIVCRFSGGMAIVVPRQLVRCTARLETGVEEVAFDTREGAYRAGGEMQGESMRVFAGVRSDPWFLDAAKTLKYNASLPVLPGPGINGLWGQNVLSIVVEVDKQALPGPLLAVTGQTIRR